MCSAKSVVKDNFSKSVHVFWTREKKTYIHPRQQLIQIQTKNTYFICTNKESWLICRNQTS